MTVGARRFTPEVLLSAPRRSTATPSPDGTAALFTVTTYSFQTQKKTSEIRVLDIKTGQTKVLSNDAAASEPTWLGLDNGVLWLKGAEKGTTELYGVSLDFPDERPQLLKTFPGSVSNLKVTGLDSDNIALAVTGLATPDGKLYNSETAEKPKSTGRVYSKLFVRQWDSYVTENKSSIFYTTLTRSPGAKNLSSTPLYNALTGQVVSLESPVPPFGGSGDFDISKNGLIFVAKDPKLDKANHTKTDLYYIPLRTFTETQSPPPLIIKTGNLKGYSASPVFSPDARSVAFTRMKSDQYESDKPRLLLLPNITDLPNVQEFYETEDGEGKWDLRPDSIAWSKDGEELYVTAEENGRGKLFRLPASPRHAKDLPEALTDDGTVSDVKVLPNKQLFLSSTSLVDNSIYSILDPKNPKKKVIVSSNAKGGKTFGLSQDQVDEFWYQGAEDYSVHAWVVKPSFFKKGEKYPLAYLIHGGPQGAWNESWSTRWNPAIFAEQGYVVVTPNPTGSTGYGMAFQNGIRDNWGGRPYTRDFKDLFATLVVSLPLAPHRVRLTRVEHSFLSEEAINNLGSLKFSQSNRMPDPKDPSRIVTTTTTTTFSMAREMARSVCQRFLDARFIESADGKQAKEFTMKGSVWQLTPKGIHVLERFCAKNGIQQKHVTELVNSPRNTMQLVILERDSATDKLSSDRSTIEVIFRRFVGTNGPNVKTSTNSADSDSLSEYKDGIAGVRMASERKVGSPPKVVYQSFTGKAASDWLMDCCMAVDRRETTEIATLFLEQDLIWCVQSDRLYLSQMGLDKDKEVRFQPTKHAIYQLSQKGKDVLNMVNRERTSESEGTSPATRPGVSRDSNTQKLDKILNDAALRLLFRENLRDTHCEENLSFYLDVDEFLKSCRNAIKASSPTRSGNKGSGQSLDSVKETMASAYGIYNAFLAPGSPCELNIDHLLRNQLATRMTKAVGQDAAMIDSLKEVTKLFEEAQISVFKLMASDSVPKFMKSSKYEQTLKNYDFDSLTSRFNNSMSLPERSMSRSNR